MIDVTKQQPVIASSVPVQGTIQESRLVGTALYVVSQIYQYREDLLGERVWEWGSLVSSYDLSDPSPTHRPRFDLDSWLWECRPCDFGNAFCLYAGGRAK